MGISLGKIIATPSKEILLTRKQAAERLGLRPQSLAAWATNKRYNLPYIKVGRHVKYRPSDIEAFLKANTHNRAPESSPTDIQKTTPGPQTALGPAQHPSK